MPREPVQRLRAQFQRDQELAQQKQERLGDVAAQQADTLSAQWEDHWPSLVHGKDALAALARSELSPYRDLESLIDAVAAHCQRLPADLPADLQRLRTMLQIRPEAPRLAASKSQPG
jgi:hypothetical protein